MCRWPSPLCWHKAGRLHGLNPKGEQCLNTNSTPKGKQRLSRRGGTHSWAGLGVSGGAPPPSPGGLGSLLQAAAVGWAQRCWQEGVSAAGGEKVSLSLCLPPSATLEEALGPSEPRCLPPRAGNKQG